MIKRAIHRQQKIIIVVLIFVILSLSFAILWVTYLHQMLESGGLSLTSTTPTPTPISETVATPSAYANDSTILSIEVDLEANETDLQEVDLRETGLNPPVLDMEVEFEE